MILPNICKNSSILLLILYTELTAILASLINEQWSVHLLGIYSIYMLWIVLGTTYIICFISKHKPSLNSYILLASSTYFVFLIIETLFFIFTPEIDAIKFSWQGFLRRCAVVSIAIFFICRLFSLLGVLEQRNKAETDSRMQALQSRIRPHFLFNCLNTISELTQIEPKQAEKAINSLSLLFRAGIESERRFHNLESEISLCQHYIDLERWRLEERLSINWHIETKQQNKYQVPRLILQPLIENAIIHGAQRDGRVQVRVDIRESKQDISIVVENKKSQMNNKSVATPNNEGNGIAMDNIRERLFVLYDDQQTFRVKDTSETYSVLMRFPKQPTP